MVFDLQLLVLSLCLLHTATVPLITDIGAEKVQAISIIITFVFFDPVIEISSMNMLNIDIDRRIIAKCLSNSRGFTRPLKSSRPRICDVRNSLPEDESLRPKRWSLQRR
jgi:hypothetical protein